MDPPIAATTTISPNKSSTSRTLHSKRSFGSKYPYGSYSTMPPHHLHGHLSHGGSVHQPLDSPAYDASEEDNDPQTDSGASAVSVHASAHPSNNTRTRPSATKSGATAARRHVLASSLVSSDDGVDSLTYDGDIESSTTAGPETPYNSAMGSRRDHYASSVASTLSPSSPTSPSLASGSLTHPNVPKSTPSPPALHRPTPMHPSRPTEPSPASKSSTTHPLSFDPAKLSPEDIEGWFQEVRVPFFCFQSSVTHQSFLVCR